MRVKAITVEDFVNYKKPCMLIGTISCGGKCCAEAGIPLSVCQNNALNSCPVKTLSDDFICQTYINNPLTHAVVFGGLEPFEQSYEMFCLIKTLRNKYKCNDDVVIYTGYNKDEIVQEVADLARFPNIIIKFGRYVPNQPSHFDELLGVKLASPNQYAERIS